MKLHADYAIKPMGDLGFGALACVSIVSPWPGFAAGLRVQERHTTGNAAMRPKGLTEGSTV